MKKEFPGGAARIAKADPGEVEEFVSEYPGALDGVIADTRMKMDFAAAD